LLNEGIIVYKEMGVRVFAVRSGLKKPALVGQIINVLKIKTSFNSSTGFQ
jgi:hypothetical protein